MQNWLGEEKKTQGVIDKTPQRTRCDINVSEPRASIQLPFFFFFKFRITKKYLKLLKWIKPDQISLRTSPGRESHRHLTHYHNIPRDCLGNNNRRQDWKVTCYLEWCGRGGVGSTNHHSAHSSVFKVSSVHLNYFLSHSVHPGSAISFVEL